MIRRLAVAAVLGLAACNPAPPPPLQPVPRVLVPAVHISPGCVNKTKIPWLDVWPVTPTVVGTYRYVDSTGQQLYGGHVIGLWGEQFALVHTGTKMFWAVEWWNTATRHWYRASGWATAPLPGTQICLRPVTVS